MTDLQELPFRTIPNSGRMDGLSNQCMFISIYHYFKYVKSNNSINLSEIRTVGGLESGTSNTMYDFQDSRFDGCLNKICDHYNIKIKIYYANRRANEESRWVGKCQWKFGNSNSNIVRIVALKDHFELITNIGDKEYISEKLINPKAQTKVIPDSKSYSKPYSKPYSKSDSITKDKLNPKSDNVSVPNTVSKEIFDKMIESILKECVETRNIIDDIYNQNSMIINEIVQQEKDFTDKKAILLVGKDMNKEIKKLFKNELVSIKELIEKNMQVVENNKKYTKKLDELINSNMEIVHKLEKL